MLGDTIRAGLSTFLQPAAESDMTDRCVIRARPSRMFNPGTDNEDLTPGAVLYPPVGQPGICRVRLQEGVGTGTAAGEQSVQLRVYKVSVPHWAAGFAPDNEVTITTSADPYVQGRTLTVTHVDGGTHVTARRLMCLDNQG